jgi:hypothetical protein
MDLFRSVEDVWEEEIDKQEPLAVNITQLTTPQVLNLISWSPFYPFRQSLLGLYNSALSFSRTTEKDIPKA